MRAIRSPIRPDGKYYRTTRRQRVGRSRGRSSGGPGAASLLLVLAAFGVGWWAMHQAHWLRWGSFTAAVLLVVVAIVALPLGRR